MVRVLRSTCAFVKQKTSRFGRVLAVAAITFAAIMGMLSPGMAHAQASLVGGHAPSQAYPWMVSLQGDWKGDPNFHFCGGALLFRDQVVTNAHCVSTLEGTPNTDIQYHVRAGSADRTSGGETAMVTKITIHPEWAWGVGAPEKRVADIAVLKLDHKLNLQTIELAGSAAKAGDKVRLLGWGATEPDGSDPLPTMLQELDTTVTYKQGCSDVFISKDEICLKNPNGTDGACYGDSGSPALKKEDGRWKLVGSASRITGEWCGLGDFVYTSTPAYRTWIYDTARGVPAPTATSSGSQQTSNISSLFKRP